MELANFERLTISLRSGTLADAYSIDHLTDAALGTAYSGSLYGWPWGCTVRSKTHAHAGRRTQLVGDYDISETLKRYITFSTAATQAGAIMDVLAAQLGKTAAVSIDSHGVRRMSEQTTVMQVLSSLFGWTSAIPHQFVNVFLRGSVLHVMQRGKESSSYALQAYNIISQSEKTIDTLMTESLWDPKIIGDPDGTYFSGTVTWQGASVTYVDGYVTQVVAGSTVTTFGYSSDDQTDPDSDDRYIVEKSETGEGHFPYNTVYSYASHKGSLYLAEESQTEYLNAADYQPWYAGVWLPLSVKSTTYIPLGNGFYAYRNVTQQNAFHASYYGSGFGAPGWYPTEGYTTGWTAGPATVTNSISEGRPGGKATPRERGGEENTPTVGILYNPIAANHIPVTDTTTLQRYADGLAWLDGKTEYALRVECYDAHVVDFDQTVTVAGHTWHLDANQITIDGKGIRQALDLVRWA